MSTLLYNILYYIYVFIFTISFILYNFLRTFFFVFNNFSACTDLLPSLPTDNETETKPTAAVEHLERICERLETLVDRLEHTLIAAPPAAAQEVKVRQEAVAEPLPTPSPPPPSPPAPATATAPAPVSVSNNMSVAGFEDIVAGSLSEYLALSNKIGGDVAQHAQYVKAAFE